MGYRIRRSEKVADAARRIAGEQVGGALDDIDHAGADVETAVHEVRKRCKKMRGLVRLVRPALGDAYRRENAWFRDTARELSGTRDRQVMGRTFDAVCARAPSEAAAERIRSLREPILAGHGADAPDEGEALDRLRALRPALTEARERVADWSLDGDGFDAIEPGLRRTFARARRAMGVVEENPGPEAVHEWRKRVKYHWYHARLLANCWRPVMDGWRKEADRLGELLGDAHDLATLRASAAARLEAPDADDALSDLLGLIDQWYSELRAQALACGGNLYTERPRGFTARMRRYWENWHAPR